MNQGFRTAGGKWARRIVAAVLGSCVGFVQADTLVLKSGHRGTGTKFRREGDRILFQMEARGPDGKVNLTESGVEVAKIERVEREMPLALKQAPALLAAGKAASALPAVAAAEKSAEPFGELPGSWWPQLAVLHAHTLLAVGNDDKAAALAGAMERSADPGLAREGAAVRAVVAGRKGDFAAVAQITGPIWKEMDSLRPGTIAAAAVARGFGFLGKKQFVEALKSFLVLPVFTPDESALSGIARLGAAQAYYGLEDYDRAIAELEILIQSQPDLPEAAKARTLLPEWQRRRSAVNEARGS